VWSKLDLVSYTVIAWVDIIESEWDGGVFTVLVLATERIKKLLCFFFFLCSSYAFAFYKGGGGGNKGKMTFCVFNILIAFIILVRFQ